MKSWQHLITITVHWLATHHLIRVYLAAGLVIVIAMAWWFGVKGNRLTEVALFDSRELSADEISMMQLAFGKAGLNQYEIANQKIEVPRNQRAEYLKALAEYDGRDDPQ